MTEDHEAEIRAELAREDRLIAIYRKGLAFKYSVKNNRRRYEKAKEDQKD